MRQKNVKMAICAVTAILTFSSMDIKSNAATDLSSVLPSAGVDYTLQAMYDIIPMLRKYARH